MPLVPLFSKGGGGDNLDGPGWSDAVNGDGFDAAGEATLSSVLGLFDSLIFKDDVEDDVEGVAGKDWPFCPGAPGDGCDDDDEWDGRSGVEEDEGGDIVDESGLPLIDDTRPGRRLSVFPLLRIGSRCGPNGGRRCPLHPSTLVCPLPRLATDSADLELSARNAQPPSSAPRSSLR